MCIYIYIYTLWLFNIAMENSPFIDDFPIKTSIYKGFSMAMLNNQMVYVIHIIDISASPHLHMATLRLQRTSGAMSLGRGAGFGSGDRSEALKWTSPW